MQEKLTFEQWEKLSKEEQRQAILELREPDSIFSPKRVDVNKIDRERFL